MTTKKLIVTRDSNQRILRMFMEAAERKAGVVKGADLSPVVVVR